MNAEATIAAVARRMGLRAGLAMSSRETYTVYVWSPAQVDGPAPTGKITMGVSEMDCQRVLDRDEPYIEAELRAAFERAKKRAQ
jgi:hypothetical protein